MERHSPFFLIVLAVLSLMLVNSQSPEDEMEAEDSEYNPIIVEINDEGFDRRAMLASIAEHVILPCNATFLDEVLLLSQELREVTAENLAASREQWRSTMQQWQRCHLFEVGDLRMMILHNQISKVPLNHEFIDEYLEAHEVVDATAVADFGSNSKGLFAIEYLLFAEDVLDNSRKLHLLASYGADLQKQAEALVAMWDGYESKFIAADQNGRATQGSLNMLVNEMIAKLSNVVLDKLGTPMGKLAYGEPQPHAAQGYMSGSSLEHIRSNIEAYRAALTGSWQDEPQLALADYLEHIGAIYEQTGETLAEHLLARVDTALSAIDALEAMEMPLHQAVVDAPEDVDALYEAARMLLILTKVDMGNQMGVTVTFNDSDGD